jgi:hypothetical protein
MLASHFHLHHMLTFQCCKGHFLHVVDIHCTSTSTILILGCQAFVAWGEVGFGCCELEQMGMVVGQAGQHWKCEWICFCNHSLHHQHQVQHCSGLTNSLKTCHCLLHHHCFQQVVGLVLRTWTQSHWCLWLCGVFFGCQLKFNTGREERLKHHSLFAVFAVSRSISQASIKMFQLTCCV